MRRGKKPRRRLNSELVGLTWTNEKLLVDCNEYQWDAKSLKKHVRHWRDRL